MCVVVIRGLEVACSCSHEEENTSELQQELSKQKRDENSGKQANRKTVPILRVCCQNEIKSITKISSKIAVITISTWYLQSHTNCLFPLTKSLATVKQPDWHSFTENTTRWCQQKMWKEVLFLKIAGGNVKWEKIGTATDPWGTKHRQTNIGWTNLQSVVNNLGVVCVIPTRSPTGLIKHVLKQQRHMLKQLKTPTCINYINVHHYLIHLF